MTAPTTREARDALAYLRAEVRAMQGPEGHVAEVRRAYRTGDAARGERGLRRVEELFQICEVMIDTVRWPAVEDGQ